MFDLSRNPLRARSAAVMVLALCMTLSAALCAASDDEAPAEAEARLLSNIRQLTFEGRRAGEGYYSADGKQMVFQSEREPGNPFYQIYLMDLETGDIQRVSPGQGKTTCSWIHPSGKRVLFASTHLDPQAKAKQEQELELRASGKQRRYSWSYDEEYEIFDCEVPAKEYRNLTNARGYDAEGSWSPDGRYIAFASNRHGYTEKLDPKDAERFEVDRSLMMEIYIMDADGGNVRRLTHTKGYDGGPFFSPDGKRICWRRFSEDGVRAEIWTMNIDGSDQQQLTHLGAMSWAPYYHPSGEYLVFTTNIHGFANFELYLVDAAGQREPVRATFTDGWDGLPVFSPDGKQLAWSTARSADKSAQIFLADWNHAAAQRLLSSAAKQVIADAPTDEDRAAPPPVETEAGINAADLRKHIEYLASDELDGRMTGTRGETLATAYVASLFRKYGLEPAGDDGTYFQAFEFTFGLSLGADNTLSIYDREVHKKTDLEVDSDWRPLSFSKTGEVEYAGVMFAGYGIIAPQGEEFDAYDSLADADVKDKWVMVLRFMPEDITPEQRQHLSRHSSLRYKAMVLRDRGAHGMIVVSGPNAQVKQELIELTADASLAGTSLPAISISNAAADKLLAAGGKTLKALQDELDDGAQVPAFDLARVMLGANIEMEQMKRQGRSVLGRLRSGSDKPAVVLGAHVDHLGHGGANSRAGKDEQGQIHYGADDNASGVAGVLEIAEYLADARKNGKLNMQRDLICAAWSGEEIGLLGSSHFVDQLDEQTQEDGDIHGKIAAYLNMDMIGRLDEKLVINGVSSSSVWPQEIERRNVPVGLKLAIVADSYLPTDTTPFYLHGVPVLNMFSGIHTDYHTPRDTADKIDYEGAARIARLMGLITRSLVLRGEEPDYVQVEATGPRGSRAGLRAYLGTIPDYATADIPGVKLTGVSKGGPAEKAGLRGGDIIIKLAGTTIENIHDYTYAIDALKIGQEVEVVVKRDGADVTLTITPASRE